MVVALIGGQSPGELGVNSAQGCSHSGASCHMLQGWQIPTDTENFIKVLSIINAMLIFI